MSARISIGVGIIGIVTTILLVQTVAVAKSPVEVQRIAKQVTVQITGCGYGSGVIIRKNSSTYTVLTVAHAVKKSGCTVTMPDDTKYQITGVKTFPNKVDLAVFTFTSSKNYLVAKLTANSDLVEAGETIYVSGFPLSSAINNSIFSFVSGILASNISNKQQGNGYSLLYFVSTLPGHSGGPIWNKKGELIGIHGRGDTELQPQPTINDSVRVKTGYSLGITVNTFTKLATAAGITGYRPVVGSTKFKSENDLFIRGQLKYQNSNTSKSQEALAASYREALVDINRAIEINDLDAKLYYSRGIIKAQSGDNSGALADYDRTLLLDPKLTSANYTRGLLKANKLNDTAGALADYNRAIAIEPNDGRVYSDRGILKASKLNDTAGALADYNRAIAIYPSFADPYYARGLLKETKLNDTSGALADYDRAITINNQDIALNITPAIGRSSYFAEPYYARGLLRANKLKNRTGAVADLKQAAKLFQQQFNDRGYQRAIDALKKVQQNSRD